MVFRCLVAIHYTSLSKQKLKEGFFYRLSVCRYDMYVYELMKREWYEGTEMTWDDVDIASVANILPAVLLLHFDPHSSIFNIIIYM